LFIFSELSLDWPTTWIAQTATEKEIPSTEKEIPSTEKEIPSTEKEIPSTAAEAGNQPHHP
jgi:hypothetical protein